MLTIPVPGPTDFFLQMLDQRSFHNETSSTDRCCSAQPKSGLLGIGFSPRLHPMNQYRIPAERTRVHHPQISQLRVHLKSPSFHTQVPRHARSFLDRT